MYIYCEIATKYLIPVFRSYVAKALVEKHEYNQTKAAKILGITQAAISQYINARRGNSGIDVFQDSLPLIENFASDTAEKIAYGLYDSKDVAQNICNLCSILREKNHTGFKIDS